MDKINSNTKYILEADKARKSGDIKSFYNIIYEGLCSDISNYELYYMLGEDALNEDFRKAVVYFRLSLHFCHDENDKKFIEETISSLINDRYNEVNFSKIKLIIWDMDNTFWKGIISEGNVDFIDDNISLIKRLTDCGVVNSISSKNDEEPVLNKIRDIALDSYFVFNDINWENKGVQIKTKLKDMALRAENTLFIDDDIRNLNDCKYHNPDIMTAEPDIIPALIEYFFKLEATDPEHKRLQRYQTLEIKRNAQKNFSNSLDFLKDSNIKLEIKTDCLNEFSRIIELISRTNQLNYTKLRSTAEEIRNDLDNPIMKSGYIHVTDKYGDYGIVGFYCLDSSSNSLKHFLFSCRVIGMGIENYIYQKLNCPTLNIIDPIAVKLEPCKKISWINETKLAHETSKKSDDTLLKILIKGPCDVSAIESYLIGGDLTTEFNYINDKGFVTAGQNHTYNILQYRNLSQIELQKIYTEVPFVTPGDYETSIFDTKYHVIIMSLLPDCHAGLYRNKKNGRYINFGSKNFNLTDPANFQGYIDGTIVNHAFPFTESILQNFSENWKFIGVTPTDELIRNIDYIVSNVKGSPYFIFLLGSEIEYENEGSEFANQAEIHKEVNAAMQKYADNKPRINLINMTDFIHSQEDYSDSINHFKRHVYYDLASKIVSLINSFNF
ncbi:HAD-superfamily phosphatase, subfamily IIIC/FkbH-like domain-containing protein [Lachnospiraceae bacterium KH1T2]|nr:HAD-superfamily phosphatase, subfamily IIIC/FkbH-like domain-containing protein [Lachnospiraceae bacterium KH1T2]